MRPPSRPALRLTLLNLGWWAVVGPAAWAHLLPMALVVLLFPLGIYFALPLLPVLLLTGMPGPPALIGLAIANALLWGPCVEAFVNWRMTTTTPPGPASRHVQTASRLCPVCGYDLWATIERCPECGTETGWTAASDDPDGP